MNKVSNYIELKAELDKQVALLESSELSFDEVITVHKTCMELIAKLEDYIANAEVAIEQTLSGK